MSVPPFFIMPRLSIFENKVFYTQERSGISDVERELIVSILKKHNLDTDFLSIDIIDEDFFGVLFIIKYDIRTYLIRASLNIGLWDYGDNICKKANEISVIFFDMVASGVIDSWEYAVFDSVSPKNLSDSSPELRVHLSRFFGASLHTLSDERLSNIELPTLAEAYDKYFDILGVFKDIPAGAKKQFKLNSPTNIETLEEFSHLLREDFYETLNNLPPPPRFLDSICFGPIDYGSAFFDPYLKFLPPMFPYRGDPYIDIAVNCHVLGLAPKEAIRIFGLNKMKEMEAENYIKYLYDDIWQPLIVQQLLGKFISFAFGSFPVKSIIDMSYIYHRFCRQRILRADKYKKISKSVDDFFLKDIIY